MNDIFTVTCDIQIDALRGSLHTRVGLNRKRGEGDKTSIFIVYIAN